VEKLLKEKRVQLGYSQAEVAKLANISRSYYTHIEMGTKQPSVNVAKSIASVLELEWIAFFETKCS